MGLAGLIAIGFIVCWHNRRQKELRRCEMAEHEQKSNNENEENLRRYRNPLFETDKGGGTGKQASTEMIEIDLEKYEKSPARRIILHNENDNNDYNDSKQNTPMKMTKKKDINIEISRTLMDRDRDRDLVV